MPGTITRAYADLRSSRTDRVGWNLALISAVGPGESLVVDLSGIEHLDVGFLSALATVEPDLIRRGGGLRLRVADEDVRQLLRLQGLDRMLDASGGLAVDLSCMVSVEDAGVLVSVQRSALQNQRLAQADSFTWLRRVSCPSLVVDLSELVHVNSVLVAWILQLAQMCRPAQVTLRGVSRQVDIQLGQLRLNHLLKVEGAVG